MNVSRLVSASAFGLLASPHSFEIVRSDGVALPELTAQAFAQKFEALERETVAYLAEADVAQHDTRVVRKLDMRYKGQGYEVEVRVPDLSATETVEALPELFKAAYEAVFSIPLRLSTGRSA